MEEAGHEYFTGRNISTTLYDQGLLTPLPAVPGSQQFPDKEVMAIGYVMVVVACPSSQNVANDDPNRFGRTCLMGLWGLQTKKALQHCHKMCSDGVNRITVAFCPFCEYWMTNDLSPNNRVCKHYGIVMAFFHEGYTTGSVALMKTCIANKHSIVMESAPRECKRTK